MELLLAILLGAHLLHLAVLCLGAIGDAVAKTAAKSTASDTRLILHHTHLVLQLASLEPTHRKVVYGTRTTSMRYTT